MVVDVTGNGAHARHIAVIAQYIRHLPHLRAWPEEKKKSNGNNQLVASASNTYKDARSNVCNEHQQPPQLGCFSSNTKQNGNGKIQAQECGGLEQVCRVGVENCHHEARQRQQ